MMEIFVVNIILVLFYAVLINCIPHVSTAKKNKLFIVICGIQLFIIHCFKDFSSLSDLTNYVGGYNYISQSKISQIFDIDFSVRFEPGWIILNKILSYISDNYLILFAVTSFVIILGYSKLILLYSAIPWLSVFLFLTYIFIPSLYILRQHLALAILLFSLPYIVKRRFLKFLLVVLLAISMHFTAIVFLIAYFIYPVTIGKKFWITFATFVFVSRFLIAPLLLYLMSMNEGYARYLDYLATNSTDFFISLCVLGLFVYSTKVSRLEGIYKLFFFVILCCYNNCNRRNRSSYGRKIQFVFPGICHNFNSQCFNKNSVAIALLGNCVCDVLFFEVGIFRI